MVSSPLFPYDRAGRCVESGQNLASKFDLQPTFASRVDPPAARSRPAMTLWDVFLSTMCGIYYPGGIRIRVILRQNRLQILSWLWDRGVCTRFWVCNITIGWRAFAWDGVTYEFFMDEYLVINNKVYQDIRLGVAWVSMYRRLYSDTGRPTRPRPPPPAGVLSRLPSIPATRPPPPQDEPCSPTLGASPDSEPE